jgi:glycosyltransferase involved in cell wall biosynthesis
VHIAIVSDFGHVSGGAAKVAIESAVGLAVAGHRVAFFYAIGPQAPELAHPNIEPVHLPFPDVWSIGGKLAAARQGVWNAEAGRALTQAFAQRRDSLSHVHLHQWTKAFSPAAIAAAGASGLPVFVTVHDYFSFCPQGNYFNVPAARVCDRSPMSAGCLTSQCDRQSYAHKLVRIGRTLATTGAFGRCRDLTFVHVSAVARRFAEPHLPSHARHVTVENMVEIAKQPPTDVAGNRRVLFLGRLVAEKGPHLLAAAARAAGMPVRFVGDGPVRADILAANPSAEVTGWLPADAVAAEIASARAVAAPSLWHETGPLVVAEAMACGVPPIVAASMGAAAWVRDGIDGVHIDPQDPASLAAALRTVADPSHAAKLGSAAYESYWRDPLTSERHTGRLAATYAAACPARLAKTG